AGIRPQRAAVPFRSSVEGRWLEGPELDAGYWYRNLRRTVRFDDAVRSLAERDTSVWVEVSAHPVLAHGVVETLEAAGVRGHAVTGTLRRDDGGLDRFLRSAAELQVRGAAVDWVPLLTGTTARVRPWELPTYPFQHRHYWLASAPAATAPGEPVMDIGTGTDIGTRAGSNAEEENEAGVEFARRLRDGGPEEREALLLGFIREEAAAVLGHETSDSVAPDGVFFDIGFVSLTAVELRNRLQTATGLELPALLIFEEPTPGALARYLADLLAREHGGEDVPPVVDRTHGEGE
ncbi:acyltransferase domain-containing protein, partial [Streptomyces minutiscleroticus]|uniref:acyltransferase domain-containing protein n=1 Tax=Streptomyces minutiscleroticus TaxID=68238 RepID=UPI00167E94F3